MTPDILDIIKKRDKALYQHGKSGQKEDYRTCCELRNKTQSELKKIPNRIFLNKIEEDKDNSKTLWNHIKKY